MPVPEPQAFIHLQGDRHYWTCVQRDQRRIIAPRSPNAFLSKGTTNSMSATGWCDHKHAHDWPFSRKELAFLLPGTNIDHGPGNLPLNRGNDQFAVLVEGCHIADMDRKNGPVIIIAAALFKRGQRNFIYGSRVLRPKGPQLIFHRDLFHVRHRVEPRGARTRQETVRCLTAPASNVRTWKPLLQLLPC